MRCLTQKEFLFLLTGVTVYFVLFGSLSVFRHLSLNSTYLDLGLESQAIWNTSQGRFFETSFGSSGELISALSYHFTPVIWLLAPIYFLFPDPIMLLILQTLILSLGAVPVFLIAKAVLPDGKIKYALTTAYFLYPPLQYSNLSDFHYVTLATTFLLFAFYYLIQKRWGFFYLFLLSAVSTKENMALVAALFGVYLFFFLKERGRGLAVFFISVVYFFAVLYYVLPSLGGGVGALGRYEYLGQSAGEIVWNLTSRPVYAVGLLFNRAKLTYFLHLFASVGFLPLLSPAALLLSASELFLNLFSAYNPQWQVKFHYTAAITPFIFVSAVYGAGRLKMLLTHLNRPTTSLYSIVVEGIMVVYLIFISVSWSRLHSPSPLFYKFDRSIYQETTDTVSVRRTLSTIPSTASVSAMNNLGAHLANRRFLFRFPINYLTADYVVVDPKAAAGSFDLSQVTSGEYEELVANLNKSGNFEKIVSQPRIIVYRRNRTL